MKPLLLLAIMLVLSGCASQKECVPRPANVTVTLLDVQAPQYCPGPGPVTGINYCNNEQGWVNVSYFVCRDGGCAAVRSWRPLWPGACINDTSGEICAPKGRVRLANLTAVTLCD